jgi:hypothetical protein
VVLATHGPSDLEAVDHALLPQVLQDTAWQLALRQSSPQDAERMAALFGGLVEDESWRSDGLVTTRMVERPRVQVDEWTNSRKPGDAWLRVAPSDKRASVAGAYTRSDPRYMPDKDDAAAHGNPALHVRRST